MTNPDNVGGLPERWRGLADKCEAEFPQKAQIFRWCANELCRAAPAGGDEQVSNRGFVTFENGHMKLDVNAFLKSPEGIAQLKSIHDASEHFATEPAMRIVLIEKDGRKAIRTWDDIGDLPAGEYFLYTRTDSAPAGSGEVDVELVARMLEDYATRPCPIMGHVEIQRQAALLRKLQQGA